MKQYNILLYYCYTPIEDPEQFRFEHHLLCLELNLLGRIIIAAEGINGTVSGLKENCEKYMQILKSDPKFSAIDFKAEEYDKHAFQKLHIRVKPEIVHSDLNHIDPTVQTGIHLAPEEFRQLKDQDDVVLLDVRSNYEHHVGKFKMPLRWTLKTSGIFPDKVSDLEPYKDKKVITYCTGGIKCERPVPF